LSSVDSISFLCHIPPRTQPPTSSLPRFDHFQISQGAKQNILQFLHRDSRVMRKGTSHGESRLYTE
ncbi:MAG: hypothetical protein ACAI35_05365, partial [Candidatus Methylacidiphilales bacterium]